MLLAYLQARANALAEKWDAERARITSGDAVLARGKQVRERVLEMLGGLPGRIPLTPVVKGVLDRNGYRVEKLMFQSRPDFWVTGMLYVPTGSPGPFPAIVSPSGHYEEASRTPPYQLAHLNLVKSGFVVLAYDPIGQGERRYYWDPQTRKNELGTCIFEHTTFGLRLILLGEVLMHCRVWDGMRAIDYLETRPEVDKNRIGCTGHSGGGTETLFVTALDQRVKCAVCNEPGEGIEHWWPLHYDTGESPRISDAEHHLLPAALNGIDYCDVFQSIAPRPLLMTKEWASDRKFQLATAHVRAAYERLGAADRFATEEATDAHAWTSKLRLATANWFCRWFSGRPGPTHELARETERIEELYCTANGSLRYSHLGTTLHDIIVEKQRGLPPARGVPKSPADLDAFQRQMRQSVVRVLGLEGDANVSGVRLLANTPRMDYRIEKIELLSEPGIYLTVWVWLPERPRRQAPAIVYFNEAGLLGIGAEGGMLEKLVQNGNVIVAVEVRGAGQTRPVRVPRFEQSPYRNLFDIETGMAYLTWSMRTSLLGMRVMDVRRAVSYAFSRPEIDPERATVIGQGPAALWVLFAAALDPRIKSAVCDGMLISYRAIAGAERFLYSASALAPGALKHFDLPQIAASIAGRRLTLVSPLDGMRAAVPLPDAEEIYRFASQTFEAAGRRDRFRIVKRQTPVEEQYLQLAGM